MRIVRNADGSYPNSGPLAGLRRFLGRQETAALRPDAMGRTGGSRHEQAGSPGAGGAIFTASGLTFIAATNDARFGAFETKTGKLVWEVKLPAQAYATPVTYEVRGERCVAIVATGGSLVAGLCRAPVFTSSRCLGLSRAPPQLGWEGACHPSRDPTVRVSIVEGEGSFFAGTRRSPPPPRRNAHARAAVADTGRGRADRVPTVWNLAPLPLTQCGGAH
jgi:hypothetical protein